jgi:hypothetical protein
MMAGVGRNFGVYAWCAADTHLHIGAFCSEEEARELARRVKIAMQRLFSYGVPFHDARIRPVYDQSHASNLLHYIIGQSAHHAAPQDDAHEANCIHDLLGARVIASWLAVRLREHLARVTRESLLAPLGLRSFNERSALDLNAIAAAFALPGLDGPGADAIAARRVAAHLATPAERPELAEALGVSPRTLRRLASEPVHEGHLRAIRRQLGLRDALAAGISSLAAGISTLAADTSALPLPRATLVFDAAAFA